MTNFTDVLAIMSNTSVLDYAEGKCGKAFQQKLAVRELSARVRKGLVNNLDFARAAAVLDFA